MEIGGYIELDAYRLPMLHEEAIKLNCSRNALWYLIKARNIRTIWMPIFMCNSCDGVLQKEKVTVKHYSVGYDFKPIDLQMEENEWLFVVNFYGQLSNEYLEGLKKQYHNLIVDNTQAYFQMPILGVDTLYSCRKYFGVADGAILYTDVLLDDELPRDESFERMHFLMGRYERTASEFYPEYVANNRCFIDEPIKRMSKLTENFLHGIDYDFVKDRRTENFELLQDGLKEINQLSILSVEGAFMYPLMIKDANRIKKELVRQKIYIPTLWPNVIENCELESTEWKLSHDVMPLPVDQRYSKCEMEYLVESIRGELL